jgi:peptide chain release factor subunit 1
MEDLKTYREARGDGTSLITLLLPAGYQLSIARQNMKKEYSTAVNIKSRTNRLSVQRALRTIQQCLKNMNHVEETGVALLSGSWV